MTYFDRVTGPFRARKGPKKEQYELRMWAGATHVGSRHFTVKDEALLTKKNLEAMIAERGDAAELEPTGPMDAAKRLEFWLVSLWTSFNNCKTREDAEVLKAKAVAMEKAQRAMLLVGGTTEISTPDLMNIPQEELEKKLKVVK